MDIKIPYGKTVLSASIPADSIIYTISEPEKCISKDYFVNLISTHLQSNPADLSRVRIVVADKTRVCGYPDYLPVLINTLEQFGMDPAELQILIGYGTHPPQTRQECIQSYGDIYLQYDFIHHNCEDSHAFHQLGKTKRGVPVRIRKDLLEASYIITMGPICHHYFAGYGGGRKLIFPGLGEKEAIYANHSLYLDKHNRRLQPHCQPGILAGNPLAEDLFDYSDFLEADMAIHGIMNSHGELCDMLLGKGKKSYLEACRIHGRYCEATAHQYPFVIGSCGGYPKDINYIQSHKAIHNASMFVEDGGTLLMYAECLDGIGSKTFLPWFTESGFSGAFELLSENYAGNGGTALATMSKNDRITIYLVTTIPPDICTKIGFTCINHEEAQKLISHQNGNICFLPNASLLVKRSELE